MINKKIIYKTMALVSLALLFLCINSAFAQSLEVDYLCELGKTFYAQGRADDALSEFTKVLLVDPNNQQAKEYINKIVGYGESVLQECRVRQRRLDLHPVGRPETSQHTGPISEII